MIIAHVFSDLLLVTGSEEGEEEDFTYEAKGSSEDVEFDTIVGALEEILLDEEFSSTQSEFCHRHCGTYVYSN